MAMSKQDKNTVVVKALQHPLRRKILRAMADDSDFSPNKLAQELGEPLGNVSYHIRLLFEDGFLKLMKTEPRRGAVEHFYKRSGNHLDRKVTAFLEMIGKD